MTATALTRRSSRRPHVPHFALDPRGVLLERPRLSRELDDLLLPVVRVTAPDVDVRFLDLDHVVTGSRVTAQAQRRDGAGVDDEEILEPPGVWNVLGAGEDEVGATTLEALGRIGGVVDDVAFAARARHGQQMVVHDEHAELGVGLELLLDPRIAPTADLPVIEVRLRRVDRDDRDSAVEVVHRVTGAEKLLEVDVADVARIVVSRDDDDRVAFDLVEVFTGALVLLPEPERGQVSRADDDVRLQLVDFVDRALEEVRHEVPLPAVEIRDVRDREAPVHPPKHKRRPQPPLTFRLRYHARTQWYTTVDAPLPRAPARVGGGDVPRRHGRHVHHLLHRPRRPREAVVRAACVAVLHPQRAALPRAGRPGLRPVREVPQAPRRRPRPGEVVRRPAERERHRPAGGARDRVDRDRRPDRDAPDGLPDRNSLRLTSTLAARPGRDDVLARLHLDPVVLDCADRR